MEVQTFTSRDICERLHAKIGGFVATAFDHAPNEFRTLYRNAVQAFPGGFRRIELVPARLIARRVEQDCVTDPDVALLILRNWFCAKSSLHNSAVGFLQTLGYQIFEPDFEHDSITHKSLQPKHIESEGDAYYFLPGSDAKEFDKLELTVMVALLGWFPDPVE